MIELAAHNNLPSGVVVNHSYVTPKVGQVMVILLNTSNRNIWICYPLLAAIVTKWSCIPGSTILLYREGNAIKVGFQPVLPPEVEGSSQANQLEVMVKEEPSEEESTPPLPSFGPCPDTNKDYTVDDEVVRLPFKFNLGDAPFSKEQQDWLLNLIYNHQKLFSLHDEDLGFYNKLANSILTTTEKPVYLPHRTIPLNFKVRLENAFIHDSDKALLDLSKSPYASQADIVRKKTREIGLCVDYQKLNSIVVRDAFPLPCIDEALQAVHNCQWFMSFNLVQGYLQMPVEEVEIQQTAFRAR